MICKEIGKYGGSGGGMEGGVGVGADKLYAIVCAEKDALRRRRAGL